jgi:hypothetical protein
MNGHIDADGLAEYRIGLITGRRERLIGAHLATCAQCSVVADRLAEVSTLLAAVPQPAIPEAVASRLESVLYQEQTVVAPARTRFRLPGHRFRLPRLVPLRVLAPVAALAVLAAGGFGLSQLSGSTASGPAFSGAAGAPAAAASSAAASSAAVHAKAPAVGSFATGHADEGQAIGVEGPLRIAASDIDLKTATLGRQLQALLRSDAQLPSTRASASVQACVQAAAAGHPVTLVASARFDGSPVTVVIVEVGTAYHGLVAGPHCAATDSDIIAMAVVSSGISTP